MWQNWQRIIKEEAEKYGYGSEKKLTEAGMKAAIEDFMYSLPKAAVDELQSVMKGTLRGGPLRDKVSSVLKKHKVPIYALGTSATQVVLDNFDTFFGESVEEAYGNPFTPSVPGTFAAPNFKGGLKAGDKVKVPHKGKMVSGKIVRFDSGGTSKAQQHGGGYVVDVGEPASVLVPAHKIVKEEVEVAEAFIRQQQWATMRSNYKQGTPVNIVLKNGKTVSGTLLRMDKYDRGTADQGHMLHVKTSGGNTKVEDVDVKSIEWNNDPKTKISEETEIEEAYISTDEIKVIRQDLKTQFPAFRFAVSRSPGSYGSIRVYILSGPMMFASTPSAHINHYHPNKYQNGDTLKKIIDVINKKNFDNSDPMTDYFSVGFYLDLEQGRGPDKPFILTDKTGKKPVKAGQVVPTAEQVEIEEAALEENHMCGCAGDGKKIQKRNKAYKQAVAQKIGEEVVRPSLKEVQYHLDSQMQPHAEARINNTQNVFGVTDIEITEDGTVKSFKWNGEVVTEAYAPLDTPNLIGAFTETTKKKRFEYRKSANKWGISHGLPHEVCVKETSPSEWRAANVKGTVCYIATDEGEGGKPVIEKWAIRNHVKYVKAENAELPLWKSIQEGAFDEAMVLAKQIVEEAKKRKVRISVDSSTSISFSKEFAAGNRDAFFDALRDCTTIRSMVRFKKRVNEWGASMSGAALGAQADLKAGRVTIHKSGDGAAYLLKAIDKIT